MEGGREGRIGQVRQVRTKKGSRRHSHSRGQEGGQRRGGGVLQPSPLMVCCRKITRNGDEKGWIRDGQHESGWREGKSVCVTHPPNLAAIFLGNAVKPFRWKEGERGRQDVGSTNFVQ